MHGVDSHVTLFMASSIIYGLLFTIIIITFISGNKAHMTEKTQ